MGSPRDERLRPRRATRGGERGKRRVPACVVTTYDARAELGDSDAPAEDQLTEAFETIVSEGAQRLHRSWREVLATGLAGGLEVATGVLALFAVLAETGSHLLGGLAFSIGFIALLLARSELFTEGFLVLVTAVVAGRAGRGELGEVWGGAEGGHPRRGRGFTGAVGPGL